jgi:hypothetical protein
VDGDRVAFAEPIPVKARIRDLVEHPDGTIALLSYDRLILLQPAPETRASASDSAAVVVRRPTRMTRFLHTSLTLVKDLAGR